MQQSSNSPFRGDSFRNRTVLVTGAGAGVGRAIAMSFATHGAKVVVNDIVRDGLEETLEQIQSQGVDRDNLRSVVGDISSIDFATTCIAEIKASFGSLDILVNNASVISEVGAFVEVSPASVERDIRVGLIGTMNMCRAALPVMNSQNFGRIINIGSDAGRAGNARLASYSATKGGVIAFTKALAQEVGPQGITVNAVCPGSVRAPMRDQILQDVEDRLGPDAVTAREQDRLQQYPTRRIAEPEDIANAVLFIASSLAEDITGQALSINGGFRMY